MVYGIEEGLQEEIEKLKEILERFCIKSNGLSMYFRADWKDIKDIKPELEELYEI